MLRIGDFARLSRVTVKALRFYDEIGLLKPTIVDSSTGYRYYSPHLLSRLNQILEFKELGFSIAEIASLLQTDLSDEQAHSALQRKRVELSQRIDAAKAQLAQVDARLLQLSVAANSTELAIALKQTPMQLVASLRAELDSYDEADELFEELQHYLLDSRCAGQRAAIWHACAGSGDRIDCEALVLLNRRVPESKRVRVYELPAGVAVSLIHQGSDDAIEQSYRAARRWIKAHGYSTTGPNREIYWPEPLEHADAAIVTEIQFPISIEPKAIGTGN